MNYSKNELTHSCGSSSSKKIKASLRFEWTSLPFMLSHRSSQLFSWDSEKCSWRKSTSCIYDFIQAYEHTCCAHSTHKPIYAEAHFQMERENPRRILYSFRCFACGLEATIVVSIKWCFLFIHMYFLHVNSVAACCYGQMYASYTCRRLKCIWLCEKVW